MPVENTSTPPDSLSTKVLEAVAEREGVSLSDLSSPLYDVVDPDALDSLFTADEGYLVFPYCGYRVTVSASGTVEIDDDADS